MDMMITNKSENAIEITDGKKAMFACASAHGGYVTVCALNASHRAWRGAGRTFASWEKAAEGYKSGFMRSAIELAREELA